LRPQVHPKWSFAKRRGREIDVFAYAKNSASPTRPEESALDAVPTTGHRNRASVLLHYRPGLDEPDQKVFRALQKINLAARLYGRPGSRASGFLSDSNRVTLGKGNLQFSIEIGEVIQRISSYRGDKARTRSSRKQSSTAKIAFPEDFGPRFLSTMMTSEETMDLLSSVRLGITWDCFYSRI